MLTKSAYHPRGIKVMLVGGTVGRVTRIHGDAAAAGANDADDDATSATTPRRSKRDATSERTSLSVYLKEEGADEDLARVLMAAADASSLVADELRKMPLTSDDDDDDDNVRNVQGEVQKSMDARANAIFLEKLKPVAAAMVSEEEEDVVAGDDDGLDSRGYAVAFDPLDGSSNLDVAGPTGSIFGVYRLGDDADGGGGGGIPFDLPPRSSMVAAGYVVYSSSTELVLAGVGKTGVVGFALDGGGDGTGTFRRSSRPSPVICPERGPYYSLNEAQIGRAHV